MAEGALGAFRTCKERLLFPDCSHANGWQPSSKVFAFESHDGKSPACQYGYPAHYNNVGGVVARFLRI